MVSGWKKPTLKPPVVEILIFTEKNTDVSNLRQPWRMYPTCLRSKSITLSLGRQCQDNQNWASKTCPSIQWHNITVIVNVRKMIFNNFIIMLLPNKIISVLTSNGFLYWLFQILEIYSIVMWYQKRRLWRRSVLQRKNQNKSTKEASYHSQMSWEIKLICYFNLIDILNLSKSWPDTGYCNFVFKHLKSDAHS